MKNTHLFCLIAAALLAAPLAEAAIHAAASAPFAGDTRDYTLTVASAQGGNPVPSIGTHASYCWRSVVTCSVDAAVSAGGTNWTCTGWTGTGSVPATGATNDTGLLTLTNVASSIAWQWAAATTDTDADGLPDDWEIEHFGNLAQPADGDYDADGRTNLEEYQDNTDPADAGSTLGLVLFYPFSGTANDASGMANTGLVFGATLTADRQGKINSAMLFDGTSHIESRTSPAVSSTSDFTYSFWIRVDSTTNWTVGQWYVDAKPEQSVPRVSFGTPVSFSLMQWYVRYDDNSNTYNALTAGSVSIGSWVQYVITRKYGDVLRMYVNGAQYSTYADPAKSLTPPKLVLGAHGNTTVDTRKLIGAMDDVRIYSRALSSNEVARLYAATAVPLVTHTVTLHPGDHGSLSNANSGADYVVTVTNGAAFPSVTVSAATGWTFTGWNPAAPATVTNDFEATAEYEVASEWVTPQRIGEFEVNAGQTYLRDHYMRVMGYSGGGVRMDEQGAVHLVYGNYNTVRYALCGICGVVSTSLVDTVSKRQVAPSLARNANGLYIATREWDSRSVYSTYWDCRLYHKPAGGSWTKLQDIYLDLHSEDGGAKDIVYSIKEDPNGNLRVLHARDGWWSYGWARKERILDKSTHVLGDLANVSVRGSSHPDESRNADFNGNLYLSDSNTLVMPCTDNQSETVFLAETDPATYVGWQDKGDLRSIGDTWANGMWQDENGDIHAVFRPNSGSGTFYSLNWGPWEQISDVPAATSDIAVFGGRIYVLFSRQDASLTVGQSNLYIASKPVGGTEWSDSVQVTFETVHDNFVLSDAYFARPFGYRQQAKRLCFAYVAYDGVIAGNDYLNGHIRVVELVPDVGPVTHTVTLHPGDHGGIAEANSGADYVVTVTNGAAFPAVTVNAEIGWSFTGWNPGAPATVTNDVTATAQYAVATNTLTVISAHGMPVPGVGTNAFAWASGVECRVSGVEESGATRHLCAGWAGTGSVPPAGATTNVSFVITNDSTLVWNWATEHRLTAENEGGQGWLSATGAWCAAGSAASVSVVADDGWRFDRWRVDGEAPHGATTNRVNGTNTVTVAMDGPHAVTAVFAALDLPEALDNAALVWATGGASNWVGQTRVTADGVDAAGNGIVSNNAQSWLETTVETGGTLSFVWRVSSKAQSDLLRFTVDGEVYGLISGETVWQTVTVTVPYGAHTFRWTYAKGKSGAAGADRGWVDQVVWAPLPPLTLAVAVNATNLTWQTEGDAGWFPQTEVTADGVAAAQSGTVADNGWSCLATRVRGSGVLAFDWRSSSEEAYDWLVFSVDGVIQRALTGESGWQRVQFALDGVGDHEIRWEYWKDESVSEGGDCGWLDRVSWSGAVPPQSGFVLWLAERGLSGDAAALFCQDRNGDGVANGFEYAYGTNLTDCAALLNIRRVNGRSVVETPERDPATTNDVAVAVEGTTNLLGGVWSLPVGPAADTAGRPAGRAWYEPQGGLPGQAFFRLRATQK